MRATRFGSALTLLVAVAAAGGPTTWAGILHEKEFLRQDLSISSMNLAARALLQGGADRPAWKRFFEAYGSDTPVFVDPRSGTLSNAVLHLPLLPGDGEGNHVTLEQVGRVLGRPAAGVDASVVGGVVRAFVVANREALGIDVAQLGPERVAQVTDELWQVSIPQQVDGIPVRGGRVLATISHGNLVLLGTETWGNAAVDTKPSVEAAEAVAAGFAYAGGEGCKDVLWRQPKLEIVPFAPDGFDPSSLAAATTGAGYGHRLVWTFGFTRADEPERWELIVDAHDKQVLALTDRLLADTRRIEGGVYPLTATGVCDTSEFCGTMQPDWPMPYADTGLPPPDDYTNGAGLYDYPGEGTATTTLHGKYVFVENGCGAMTDSSADGDIDLGGFPGQHDCASSGSAGNTAPARTAFYHLNKTIEAARGWLPFETWLGDTLPIYLHLLPGQSCGANYWAGDDGPGAINFHDGLGGECLNSAEVATVINHEWGHGLDDHDLNGLSGVNNFSEAYADVNAILRSQVSCLYYGFKYGRNQGCGVTPDGTGNNANEVIEGGLGFFHCDLQCSGHRDADWQRHLDPTPDTPQNLSCAMCGSGKTGPCGGEEHCGARPVVQAAWDFATRDLRAPPFNLSRTDAFIVASKVYYQGSQNVGAWHACNCAAGTSDGCAASSAYMQWLAADDNDGNVANGTPHAGAIEAAFGRHNVGCSEMAPPTGGCGGGPTAAPTLVAVPGMNRVDLSWSAVAGATRYRVLRTEGQAGCDTGKAVIAETTGLAYSDTGVANGRAYYYLVHAVGASGACFGPTSACLGATPVHCATTISLPRIQMDCDAPTSVTLEDWDLRGAGSTSVSAFSTTEPAPETVGLNETSPGSGRFVGTIATTSAPASHGDGAVSVVHGDTLRLDVLDASRCGAIDVPVERVAPVDCRGPVISNVHTANEQGTTAEIRWDTDEPATSRVVHGPVAPPDRVAGPDPAFVTSHVMSVGGLTACTPELFSVGSSDRLGHATTEDHAGAYFTVRTTPALAPIISLPGVPVPTPSTQGAGMLLTVQVPDAEVILDVDVKVKYTVSLTEDVTLSLLGPDMTEVVLTNRRGSGSDFTDTVFDDAAAIDIGQGASPFNGAFRPEEPLSAFNGKVAAGPWRLRVVVSSFVGPTPSLEAFELHLTYPSRTCGPALHLASRAQTDACGTAGSGEANGAVEPGETAHVSFEVVNADAAPATGVSARLSSYTPGVFVTRADSTYPDLAPGAAAYGATPYELYVDPGMACGSEAVLRLEGASNEGGWSSVTTLRIGAEVPVTTTYSITTPKPIPDLATTRSFINVADAWALTDADVGLTIDHGSPSDLDVFLVAPDGTRVELTTDNGGSFGSGYTSTVFDDEAPTSVTAGSSPFTGHYRPESPLSVLDGMQAAGAWTLEVTDDRQFAAGTLQRWSLSFTHTGVLPCATCPVSDPPGEVESLAWFGTTRDTLSWSAAPRAATYVLHRGLRSQLPALLDSRVDSCERTQGAEPTSGADLTENPPLGSFFWFLVRADNAFGMGPAGDATPGARILNANDACQ